MLRIDTHHHVIPPDYRKTLQQSGLLEAGGRALPEWSAEASLQAMADLDVATAILSVSTPGTAFLPNAADAAALARDLNDWQEVHPCRVPVGAQRYSKQLSQHSVILSHAGGFVPYASHGDGDRHHRRHRPQLGRRAR